MQSTVSGSEPPGFTLLALQLTQSPSFGVSDTILFDGDDFETHIEVLIYWYKGCLPSVVSVLQTAGSR